MAVTVAIVDNDRNWYDPEIAVNDPVVFQNVNYASGNSKSTSITRHRYIQDTFKRIIPNSVRHGLTLGTPSGDTFTVASGYAIVGGRFIYVGGGTYDASADGISTGDNYLIIEVTPEAESGTRDPTNETVAITGELVSSYVNSHNKLVLAKFNYNGSVISNLESYIGEVETQAAFISPPAAIPGGSSGYSSIILRSGQYERINNLGIETTQTRVYKHLHLDDQDTTPVGDGEIIVKDEEIQFRNTDDTAYITGNFLSLKIGASATEAITSSLALTNISSLNTHTIPGGTDTFVMRDTTDTLTNKTLTSPIVTGGTYSSPVLTTPQIEDASSTNQYIFASSELTANRTITLPLLTSDDTLVFEAHEQTLASKTLTTPVIASIYQDAGKTQLMTIPNTASDIFVLENYAQTLSNKKLQDFTIHDNGSFVYDITPSGTLSATRIANLPALTGTDTFVFENQTQTLSSKTLVTPTIADFSSATHNHNNATGGGNINIVTGTTSTLPVNRGGTGLTCLTSGGLLIGNTSANITVTSRPTSGQVLAGQVSGDPQLVRPRIVAVGGDLSFSSVSMSVNGDFNLSAAVNNDSHTHNTQYYTETETNVKVLSGSGNAEWVSLAFISTNYVSIAVYVYTDGKIHDASSVGTYLYWTLVGIPFNRGTETLRVSRVRVTAENGDANNYVDGTSYFYLSTSNTYGTTVLSPANIGDAGTIETVTINPTDIDLGSYKKWGIMLNTNSNGVGVDIWEVSAEVYYA